ncbi:uncharacterized protein LOC144666634 [Oculina patagonica]
MALYLKHANVKNYCKFLLFQLIDFHLQCSETLSDGARAAGNALRPQAAVNRFPPPVFENGFQPPVVFENGGLPQEGFGNYFHSGDNRRRKNSRQNSSRGECL